MGQLQKNCPTLFPIDWPKPFGLVMIEAMACGTPVIAFGCGSVPEVVEPGLTGFIVEDVDGAIAAVSCLGELRRTEVRRRFEARFSALAMARRYLDVYAAVSLPSRIAARQATPGGRTNRFAKLPLIEPRLADNTAPMQHMKAPRD